MLFHTEFNEKEGWPSENGQVSTLMPPPPPPPPAPEGEEPPPPPQYDVHFTAKDVVLEGDLLNASGYYGQKAKQLYVVLGKGAELTGTISSCEAIHVNENGRQNTHFTSSEYYYLGHVMNRNYFNGENLAELVMEEGSKFCVTKDGLLSSFQQKKGADFQGKLFVDGKEVVPEEGKIYTGKLVIQKK